MANLNCLLIGEWKGNPGSPSLIFNTDGSLTFNGAEKQYSFAVWTRGTDHQVITLDSAGNVGVGNFVYTGPDPSTTPPTPATLVINGNGPLLGSYVQARGAPAPLALTNIFRANAWIATDPSDPESWRWNLQYTEDGLVTTTHTVMHHTFANVYIIREDTTSSLHLIYGQMRYGGGILADYRIGASGYPTVAERVSGIVTEYTPV